MNNSSLTVKTKSTKTSIYLFKPAALKEVGATTQDPGQLLKAYFSQAKDKLFKKGEIIIQGGSPAEEIFFCVSGYVKGYTISDDGTCSLMVIKSNNDLFPMAWLLELEGKSLYYEAMTDVIARKVSKQEFRAAIETNHALSLAALKKATAVLGDYTRRLQNLTISDARNRIICRLLFLLERFGAESKNGHEVIFVPLTYPDLADSLNLSRETVNRVVSGLAKEGLLIKSHGRVIITDKKHLQAEVAGL